MITNDQPEICLQEKDPEIIVGQFFGKHFEHKDLPEANHLNSFDSSNFKSRCSLLAAPKNSHGCQPSTALASTLCCPSVAGVGVCPASLCAAESVRTAHYKKPTAGCAGHHVHCNSRTWQPLCSCVVSNIHLFIENATILCGSWKGEEKHQSLAKWATPPEEVYCKDPGPKPSVDRPNTICPLVVPMSPKLQTSWNFGCPTP